MICKYFTKSHKFIKFILNKNSEIKYKMLSEFIDDEIPDDEFEEINQNFIVARYIGKGAFGKVFLGLDRQDCEQCAVKVIVKSYFIDLKYLG